MKSYFLLFLLLLGWLSCFGQSNLWYYTPATVSQGSGLVGNVVGDYFVSSSGNDSNSGLNPSVPMATVAAALSAASPGDTIALLRGDTFPESITVSKSDITFLPYPFDGSGPLPVMSGYVSVGSWLDEGGGIYSAVPSVVPSTYPNGVLLDGAYYRPARMPSSGYYTIDQLDAGANYFVASEVSGLGLGSNAEVITKHSVSRFSYSDVSSVSGDTIFYSDFTQRNNAISQDPVLGWGVAFTRDTSILSTLGDWAYYPSESKLFVYSSSQPGTTLVAARDVGIAINFAGLRCRVKGIRFIGYNDVAIDSDGSDFNIVENCEFDRNESGVGVALATGVTVRNSTFTNNSVWAIGGVWGGEASDSGGVFVGNTVEDNGLYDHMIHTGNGGEAAFSISVKEGRIDSNVVRRVGATAIGYLGDSFLVRRNIIDSVGLVLNNIGGIYNYEYLVSGVSGMSFVSYNTISNVLGSTDGIIGNNEAYGIYHDYGSVNHTNQFNTISRCATAGIYSHNVDSIYYWDNKIFDCGRNAVSLYLHDDLSPSYLVDFRRNVIEHGADNGLSDEGRDQMYSYVYTQTLSTAQAVLRADSNRYGLDTVGGSFLDLAQCCGLSPGDPVYDLPAWRSLILGDYHSVVYDIATGYYRSELARGAGSDSANFAVGQVVNVKDQSGILNNTSVFVRDNFVGEFPIKFPPAVPGVDSIADQELFALAEAENGFALKIQNGSLKLIYEKFNEQAVVEASVSSVLDTSTWHNIAFSLYRPTITGGDPVRIALFVDNDTIGNASIVNPNSWLFDTTGVAVNGFLVSDTTVAGGYAGPPVYTSVQPVRFWQPATIYTDQLPPIADFVSSSNSIAVNQTVDYSDASANSVSSWSWVFDGGNPSTSTAQNPAGVSYSVPGSYNTTLTVTGPGGSDQITKALTVRVSDTLVDFPFTDSYAFYWLPNDGGIDITSSAETSPSALRNNRSHTFKFRVLPRTFDTAQVWIDIGRGDNGCSVGIDGQQRLYAYCERLGTSGVIADTASEYLSLVDTNTIVFSYIDADENSGGNPVRMYLYANNANVNGVNPVPSFTPTGTFIFSQWTNETGAFLQDSLNGIAGVDAAGLYSGVPRVSWVSDTIRLTYDTLIYKTGSSMPGDTLPSGGGSLIFASSFDPSTSVEASGTGSTQGISGTDASSPGNGNWDAIPGLGNPYFDYQTGSVDHNNGTLYSNSSIVNVGGSQGNVLYGINRIDAPGGITSRWQMQHPANGSYDTLYAKFRMRYLNNVMEDYKLYPEANNFGVFGEFWQEQLSNNSDQNSAGPSRISLELAKGSGVGANLFWRVKFQETVGGFLTLWDQVNTSGPFPSSDWATYEMYYRASSGQGVPDGRFYFAITPDGGQRQVIFDITDHTQHRSYAPTGIGDPQFLKHYFSNQVRSFLTNTRGNPLSFHIDDYEIWTSFPSGN